MKRYEVNLTYSVEAESEEEAKSRAIHGGDFERSEARLVQEGGVKPMSVHRKYAESFEHNTAHIFRASVEAVANEDKLHVSVPVFAANGAIISKRGIWDLAQWLLAVLDAERCERR